MSADTPLPVFAEIFQISGRKNCKVTIFALENEIFRHKNRPAPAVHAAGLDLNSRGLQPSRALRGFFDSLTGMTALRRSHACFIVRHAKAPRGAFTPAPRGSFLGDLGLRELFSQQVAEFLQRHGEEHGQNQREQISFDPTVCSIGINWQRAQSGINALLEQINLQ